MSTSEKLHHKTNNINKYIAYAMKRGKRNNNPFVSSTECILQLFNASNEGAINLDIFFDAFIWPLPFICRPCFVPCAFCISRENTYVCIDVENILNTNVYFIYTYGSMRV